VCRAHEQTQDPGTSANNQSVNQSINLVPIYCGILHPTQSIPENVCRSGRTNAAGTQLLFLDDNTQQDKAIYLPLLLRLLPELLTSKAKILDSPLDDRHRYRLWGGIDNQKVIPFRHFQAVKSRSLVSPKWQL